MAEKTEEVRRWWYAMACPYGAATASKGDSLCRFATRAARDAWVREAFRRDGYADRCKRDEVTRAEARRWFPEAFRPDSETFQPTWGGDYWDRLDDHADGAYWTGAPTGGVYANI